MKKEIRIGKVHLGLGTNLNVEGSICGGNSVRAGGRNESGDLVRGEGIVASGDLVGGKPKPSLVEGQDYIRVNSDIVKCEQNRSSVVVGGVEYFYTGERDKNGLFILTRLE